jgi:hypothetical protein
MSSLDAEAECESGVAVRIIPGVGDDLGVHHACAQDLDPAGPSASAAALAPADEAIDPQFHSRLDEREVVATERHFAIFSENAPCEVRQCTFQIGHAYPVVDRQPFDLRHHPFVRRVRRLEAIALPRHNHANGRLSAFHYPDLVGRRVRA